MTCRKCGGVIQDGAAICDLCGFPVMEEDRTAAPNPLPPVKSPDEAYRTVRKLHFGMSPGAPDEGKKGGKAPVEKSPPEPKPIDPNEASAKGFFDDVAPLRKPAKPAGETKPKPVEKAKAKPPEETRPAQAEAARPAKKAKEEQEVEAPPPKERQPPVQKPEAVKTVMKESPLLGTPEEVDQEIQRRMETLFAPIKPEPFEPEPPPDVKPAVGKPALEEERKPPARPPERAEPVDLPLPSTPQILKRATPVPPPLPILPPEARKPEIEEPAWAASAKTRTPVPPPLGRPIEKPSQESIRTMTPLPAAAEPAWAKPAEPRKPETPAPPKPKLKPIPRAETIAPLPRPAVKTPVAETAPKAEKAARQVVVATFSRRLLASFVDQLLALALAVFFLELALTVYGRDRLPNLGSNRFEYLFLLVKDYPVMAPAYGWTYFFCFSLLSLFFAVSTGRTPGKVLFDLKLIQTDGQTPTLARAVLRLIGYLLSAVPLFMGFLWITVDVKRQGLHDKLARTYVIHLGGEAEEDANGG